jgi:hypothetical protein
MMYMYLGNILCPQQTCWPNCFKNIHIIMKRKFYLFCWYWWNWWPSLFKRSLGESWLFVLLILVELMTITV